MVLEVFDPCNNELLFRPDPYLEVPYMVLVSPRIFVFRHLAPA